MAVNYGQLGELKNELYYWAIAFEFIEETARLAARESGSTMDFYFILSLGKNNGFLNVTVKSK